MATWPVAITTESPRVKPAKPSLKEQYKATVEVNIRISTSYHIKDDIIALYNVMTNYILSNFLLQVALNILAQHPMTVK